jgi:hypothetical protein
LKTFSSSETKSHRKKNRGGQETSTEAGGRELHGNKINTESCELNRSRTERDSNHNRFAQIWISKKENQKHNQNAKVNSFIEIQKDYIQSTDVIVLPPLFNYCNEKLFLAH